MKKNQGLGLDELMIVNPGPSGGGNFFLGENAVLYQVQGLGQEQEMRGLGEFFLGDDGALYQVQGIGAGGLDDSEALSEDGLCEDEGGEIGRFFLGEDGTIYEVVEKK